MINFNHTIQERKDLLGKVHQALEHFYAETKKYPVAKEWNIGEVKDYARQFPFDKKEDSTDVVLKVIKGLEKYAVHSSHPGYMGLFNPRANFPSILADFISAVLNPQLAAWSHSPYANEIERFVIQEFGKKFRYDSDSIDGTFCAGGAESNLTSVLAALNFYFPDFAKDGVFGLSKKPIIYCSTESHHSIAKAAKITGLGNDAVVSIPVGENLEMDIQLLKQQIEKDLESGFQPMMIVATAGTTGAGAIDNLEEISVIAKQNNLWFHVDAAYGGGVVVASQFLKWMKGIEKSDSITIDLHKWFSVPMGTSLFLTSNKKILHQTFKISTNYMPEDGDPNKIIDPYIHSIQWSRRFIGLKIYLPLAVFGWKGYEEVITHQVEMGNVLRGLLKENGWQIDNDSLLPIVCFSHSDFKNDNAFVKKIAEEISVSGRAWISVYPIHGKNTLRACITNYNTTKEDLKDFVQLLNTYKEKYNHAFECS